MKLSRINDPVPDAKTVRLFRDKLTDGGMIEKLFGCLDKQLDKDGVIVHKGKLVDATIVEVPIQRNSREENKELKEGNIPDDWDENKLRQKDTAARWTTKNGEDYLVIKIITGFSVIPANIHDSEMTEELLDKKEDGGQPLYADSAYRSQEIEKISLLSDKNSKRVSLKSHPF